MSALTPDLYRPMYGNKVEQFFDKILHVNNVGKPLMARYLEGYFDLFWDLHLGVRGDSIPPSCIRSTDFAAVKRQSEGGLGQETVAMMTGVFSASRRRLLQKLFFGLEQLM